MNTRNSVMSVVSLYVCTCVCALAQATNFNASGVIHTKAGVDPSQFTVEVTSDLSGVPDQRIHVGSDGRFDMNNLPRGMVHIRVVDERGSIVATSTLPSGSFAPVEIRVSAGFARGNAGPATAVSVESLKADPDGKAEREFRYALWDANDKDWKSAAKHFAKALKIDERHTRAAANWAAMELQLGNHAHAEEIARLGLKYAPSNCRLLHALGIALLGQKQLTDEAVGALSNAGKEIPKVLLMAAQAEYMRGNWDRTRQLADAYLNTGEKEFREVAERLKNGAQANPPAHRAKND
jgi:hypothetical protein